MNFQLPTWAKPAAWGVVAGAVALAIIAFSAGWVVTSGTAQEMAERQKNEAVLAALTPVCVAQFKSLAVEMRDTKLAALEEENSWQRGDYIEEQGWATMPGSEEPNNEVADACASELMKLANKASG